MTPSNPTNSQPLIYRIADKLGVFHLVAPVDHTHIYAEIPGLVDELNELWAGVNDKASQEDVTEALEGKQNILTFDLTPTADSTNPVTSGGVKAALDGKTEMHNGNNGFVEILNNGQTQVIGDQSVLIGISDMDAVVITLNNIENLKRALLNPDSSPTANSENIVTSGGVASALVEKANKDDVDFKVFEKNAASDKINLSTDFAQGQKRAIYLIFNYTSDACALSDLFTYQSGEIVADIVLPATEQPVIQVDGAVVVSVLKYSDDSSINYIIVPECYY